MSVTGRTARSLATWAVALLAVPVAAGELRVSPAKVVLDGPEATQQLLVTAMSDEGRLRDVTRRAQFAVESPGIGSVDERGTIRGTSEGRTQVVVRLGDQSFQVPVVVRGLREPTPVSFQHDVLPTLTKAGCNSGGCHGKAEGKNGFKLSVFGYDAAADYAALVKEGRGRRVFPAVPDLSLLLLKGTATVPHGGGQKIERDTLAYRRVRRWIAEGARFESEASEPFIATRIEVEPAQRVMTPGATQQLRVTAIDASGGRRCVTGEAHFESNASGVAEVDGRGLVTAADAPGEAAVLVRYMGHVAVSRVTRPRATSEQPFARPGENNFIDGLVWDKLRTLELRPSDLADDATFMRRAYLDVIGTLPSADDARAFLADTSPDKRARLVDALLDRPEYADYWAMRWADILRVDRDKLTAEGAVAMTRWLRRQFAENRPYDAFVRNLLTARGATHAEGPAAFYKAFDSPEVAGRSVSQLFLGVRIECAQCHHHPAERWSQADYVAWAGFFTGMKRKKLPGGGEAVMVTSGRSMKHPRTGEPVGVRPLGGDVIDLEQHSDLRTPLADWMTGDDNPYFARAIANRLWAHYFGRGLVDPIDDMRATNPATNEPLLAALADHLRDVDYDLKAFTRTLLASRVYQLSSEPNDGNARDDQNFSHARYKPMPAEVLYDAICQATGTPPKFVGWPSDYRAIQVWDNRVPSYFFRVFGRPVRATVCSCERGDAPSMAQALHLMNSPRITGRIEDRNGRANRMADSDRSPDQIIEELFLATLSRFPTDSERRVMLEAFAGQKVDRRAAAQDVLWALLNSKQFIYNH